MAVKYKDEKKHGSKKKQIVEIKDEWMKKGRAQTFDELRDIIVQIEMQYPEKYINDDGVTKERPSKEALKMIKEAKAIYKPTKEATLLEARRLARDGNFTTTMMEMLLDLPVNTEEFSIDIGDIHRSQPRYWKKRWDSWNWKTEVFNPDDEEWEDATHLKPQVPSFEALYTYWEKKANTRTDVCRRFNWSLKEMSEMESELRNTLNEMRVKHKHDLPELKTLPDYTNEEARERRLFRMTNVPRDDEHQIAFLNKLKMKLFGSTADGK